tara:strand:- start:778 stop:945 length:168 start_codon:yes stop_codon:yes gene_type:complete
MERKLIKGNYNPEKDPKITISKEEEPQNEFETAAIKNLGGSIAFVRDGKLYDENK